MVDEGKQQYSGELTDDLDQNLKTINEIFSGCYDLAIHHFQINRGKTECFLAYIEGTVKKDEIGDNVLKPLMAQGKSLIPVNHQGIDDLIEYIKKSGATVSAITEETKLSGVLEKLLTGYCALFVEGDTHVLMMGVEGFEQRTTGKAEVEPNLRGSTESFVESIAINTALIRRRIKTPNLKLEKLELGTISKTNVVIGYLKDIAEEEVVGEIRQRISKVEVDMILDSGQIEHMIEDGPLVPFPLMESTERPDLASLALSEGRVVIFVDGSPFVLIAPSVFSHLFMTAEDNYTVPYFSAAVTILRYMAFVISMFAPSVFIAITTYHQEMIPFSLLNTLMSARAELPFPVFLEVLLMEITFELLREAGERLPRSISGALSIVGAIVIGQAAIQAGLVSPVVVVLISVTAIASFVNPKLNMSRAIRTIKLPIMILSATLGIFGLIMGGLGIMILLVSLRSVGVPYMSPFAPLNFKDMKGMAARLPLWFSNRRPESITKKNPIRAKKSSKMK